MKKTGGKGKTAMRSALDETPYDNFTMCILKILYHSQFYNFVVIEYTSRADFVLPLPPVRE